MPAATNSEIAPHSYEGFVELVFYVFLSGRGSQQMYFEVQLEVKEF